MAVVSYERHHNDQPFVAGIGIEGVEVGLVVKFQELCQREDSRAHSESGDQWHGTVMTVTDA